MTKTTAYYLAFISLGITSASLGPTLPGLADQTHTHLEEIGNLFIARSLGYVGGSLLGGRLYDRWLGHPIMALSVFLIAAMFMGVPFLTHLWLLMLILFLVGVGEGVMDVGGNTLIVWLHGREVGPYMNGLHLFFGVGAFIAPMIVAQALSWSGNIQAAYWAFGLIVLGVAFIFAFLPSPPIRHTDPTQVEGGQMNYLLVGMITLFFFLYVGIEITMGGWISTYALETKLTNEVNAPLLASAFWAAFTFGRLVAIPLAFRLRPRVILMSDLLGTLISLVILLMFPHSLVAVSLASMLLGFSVASIFPTMLAFAERRVNITANITSIFFFGASLGTMCLPALMGRIINYFGPMALFWTILADLLLAIVLFIALMRYTDKTYPTPSEGQKTA